MKKIFLLACACWLTTAFAFAQGTPADAWINELHYDNASTDVGEFIEVVVNSAYPASDYAIYLYNGGNGTAYGTTGLESCAASGSGAWTIYHCSYPQDGIQNGSPDGIALIHQGGTVVQFLSYEGEMTATSGPASGVTSTNIGVSEPNNTPVGQSLQLTGTGNKYGDFTWTGPASESPGSVNAGQTLTAPGGGDPSPTTMVQFALASATVSEAVGMYTFEVSLSNPSATTATTVDVVLTGGTAANGSDIAAFTTQTLTFPAGSTQAQTVDVQVTDDDAEEGDETLVFSLQNVSGGENAEIGTPATFTLTITDNELPPDGPLTSSDAWINELHYDNVGTDTGEFVEVVVGSSLLAGDFDLIFYNGSNGTPYGSLNLASCSSSSAGNGWMIYYCPFTNIQNGAPDGIALIHQGSTVIQFLSYEGEMTASDGPASGVTSTDIGVKQEDPVPETVLSLQLTGSGSQYSDFTWTGPAAPSQGNVNAGQTLNASGSAPNTTVQFALASATVSEAVGMYTFEVSLSNPSATTATTVDVVLTGGTAANGSDIAAFTTQTLTFPAGSTQAQTVEVQITDDDVVEESETLVFTLQNVTGGTNAQVGAPATFTLTITDNDSPPPATTVQFATASASASEAAGTYAFEVSLSNPSATTPTMVEVALTGGTATSGADIAAFTTQTLTFPAGSTQAQTVNVQIVDDEEEESDETLVFTLQNVSGGEAAEIGTPATFTLTITDNDGTTTGVIFPGQTGSQLRANLRTTYTPDQTLGYNAARDVLFGEVWAQNNTLSGLYSGYTITLTPGADPSNDALSQGINTEHLWPQSLGAGSEPARSDMHHLAPTRENVNSARGNHPFDEIPDAQTDQWFRNNVTLTTIPSSNIDEYSEFDNSNPNSGFSGRFEPREQVKGDVARALFYFYTIYSGASTSFFEVQKDVLYQWHLQDPPDAAEQARSEEIATYQGNVNPFVSDPTLVQRAFFEDGSGEPNTPPTAPQITAPAEGETVDLSEAGSFPITWNAATDANGDALTYRVQLSTSDTFASLLVNESTGSQTAYDVDRAAFDALLASEGVGPGASTTVYLRVFASDPFTSTPSATQTFTATRRSETQENTIAAARLQGSGANVTVEGVVTRAEGDFVRIQDDTAGLTIRQPSGNFKDAVVAGTVTEGTRLQISGTLSEFNGLLQINDADIASFTVLEQGVALPEAQTVTLAQLLTNGEQYESELVRVENLQIATDDTEFRAAATYQIEDGSGAAGAVSLRIGNASDTELEGTPVPDQPFTFVGVLGQFAASGIGGYQLMPVNLTDLQIGSDPTNTPPTAPVVTAPVTGTSVTLEDEGGLDIAWAAATDADGDPVTYTVLLALQEGFGSTLLSETTGSETGYSLSHATLDALLSAAGVEEGETRTLYLRVLASDGTEATASELVAFTATRPTTAQVIAIAQARQLGAGTTVTVEGVVTRAMGAFTRIQDETGALVIRQSSGAFFDAVAAGSLGEGDVLRVTGTLSEFRGLLQINAGDLADYETLAENQPLPEAQTVTLAELEASGEQYESELVRVVNLRTETADATFQPAVSYSVQDDTGTGVLRIPNAGDSDVDGLPVPDGRFTFVGVLGQFEEDETPGYQLLPVEATDIQAQANEPPTAPVLTRPTAGTTLDVSETSTEILAVEWQAATDPDGDELTYAVEIAATDDFAEVLLSRSATGTETSFGLAQLDSLLQQANVGVGETQTLYVRVVAQDAGAQAASEAVAIAVTRALPEQIAIAQARAQGAGATVTVRGTVTRAMGAFTRIQDATGGLVIRQTSGAFFDAVASETIYPGTVLEITGTLSEFNGLMQINAADLLDFEIVAQDAELPAPQEITLGELNANGEQYESELVTVCCFRFAATASQFAAATSYEIAEEGSGTTGSLRVPNAADTAVDGIAIGDKPYEFTGVVTQFNATYELLAIEASDLTAVASSNEPAGVPQTFAFHANYPNPFTRHTALSFDLPEASAVTVEVFDVMGRLVLRMPEQTYAPGAMHRVELALGDLPAGVLYYRIQARADSGVHTGTGRMLLVK